MEGNVKRAAEHGAMRARQGSTKGKRNALHLPNDASFGRGKKCISPFNNKRNAQVSVEFLVIIAALLIIVGIGIVISNRTVINTGKVKEETNAKNTVDVIASAAGNIYAQGEGAKKRVYVIIPGNYDYSGSSVSGRTIKLRAGGADFTKTLEFQVYGSLPRNTGPNWVWVSSEGNRVRIGTTMFIVNKQSIGAIMAGNASINDSFSIQDIYGSAINISMVFTWTSTDVAASITPTSFSNLEDGKIIVVNITFIANENASGTYIGKIDINGSRENISETFTMPVTLQVTKFQKDISPRLMITPSIWNLTIDSGETAAKTFQVCTNAITELLYVNFTASPASPGAWAGSLGPLPAMDFGVCYPKTFNLTIPLSTPAGSYSGYITAKGDLPDAEDSVALQVDIGGAPTDIVGPVAHNLSKSSLGKSFYPDPITFRVIGNDTTTGNSTVIGCDLKIGTAGSWQAMGSVDGGFDSPEEEAIISIGGIKRGSYNASARCRDVWGNYGQNTTLQFKVLVPILFVTRNNGPTGRELEWSYWFNGANSTQGYLYQFENWSMANVNLGTAVNIFEFASMLIVEQDTLGNTNNGSGSAANVALRAKVKNFTDGGGWAYVADVAAEHTPVPMGMGTGIGPRVLYQSWVNVTNNSHPVTAGFPTGMMTIYTSSWELESTVGFNGTNITTTGNYSGPSKTVIGVNQQRHILWNTIEDPYHWNQNGSNIGRNSLDYVINSSTIQ